jgi:hypothetical protein
MISSSLRRKLVAYGLGAGAASLVNPANADIVYSGPLNFTANFVNFDLQNTVPPSSTNDPADDFGMNNISIKSAKLTINTENSNLGGTLSDMRNGLSYVIRLSGGETIGGGGQTFSTSSYFNSFALPPITNGTSSISGGMGAGDWADGTRGFIGLELTIGAQTFFGWADVSTNHFTNANNNAFTLYGYAYQNSEGTAITAGAVPEPSAVALLIAGAAGVAVLRRRKK